MILDPRIVDHAKNILSPAPLEDGVKSLAWDHFHNAKSSAQLATRLAGVPMPDEIKAALFDAKKISDLPLTPLDRAVTAIHRLATLDKSVLEQAEHHPAVLRVLADATKAKE